MPARKKEKVLGIDPGFGRMGWAILEGGKSKQKVIEYGCLETSSKKGLEERLSEIYTFIQDLIDKHSPDSAAVEEIYYSKNAKTAISVGQARGVMLLSLIQKSIPISHYTPLKIKSTVAGYGKADKKQMQNMVKIQLKLKETPKPDDAADALACALTHFFVNDKIRQR